jgi:hypothetical protein
MGQTDVVLGMIRIVRNIGNWIDSNGMCGSVGKECGDQLAIPMLVSRGALMVDSHCAEAVMQPLYPKGACLMVVPAPFIIPDQLAKTQPVLKICTPTSSLIEGVAPVAIVPLFDIVHIHLSRNDLRVVLEGNSILIIDANRTTIQIGAFGLVKTVMMSQIAAEQVSEKDAAWEKATTTGFIDTTKIDCSAVINGLTKNTDSDDVKRFCRAFLKSNATPQLFFGVSLAEKPSTRQERLYLLASLEKQIFAMPVNVKENAELDKLLASCKNHANDGKPGYGGEIAFLDWKVNQWKELENRWNVLWQQVQQADERFKRIPVVDGTATARDKIAVRLLRFPRTPHKADVEREVDNLKETIIAFETRVRIKIAENE